MELHSLGHQGWLVRAKGTAILVDPLLRGEFGPSRFIRGLLLRATQIPDDVLCRVGAVLLTCHHSDHFDVHSIERLAAQSPGLRVFVHDRFPTIATSILRQRNIGVSIVKVGDSFGVGDVQARFVRAYSGEFPWERGSASLILGYNECNVFVQAEGDPAAGGQYVDGTQLAVLTNNSQLQAGLRSGFFANVRDLGDPCSPIASYMSSLKPFSVGRNPPRAVVFTGTDFSFCCTGVKRLVVFDDIHSEHVETSLQQLSNGVDVYLARAGRGWRMHESGDVETVAELPSYIPTRPTLPRLAPMVEAKDVIGELNNLAVPLLMSQLGRMLVNCHRFAGEPIGPERLLIELNDRKGVFRLAFDINVAKFCVASAEASVSSTPFYLCAPLGLFVATLRGEIGVWEMAHHPGVRQAYVGRPTDSPLCFLATYFCPTVRPEHVARQHQWDLS